MSRQGTRVPARAGGGLELGRGRGAEPRAGHNEPELPVAGGALAVAPAVPGVPVYATRGHRVRLQVRLHAGR